MSSYPTLYGQQVQQQSCGHTALANLECSFWQSRMTVQGHRAEPVELVNLEQLARDIRGSYAVS